MTPKITFGLLDSLLCFKNMLFETGPHRSQLYEGFIKIYWSNQSNVTRHSQSKAEEMSCCYKAVVDSQLSDDSLSVANL